MKAGRAEKPAGFCSIGERITLSNTYICMKQKLTFQL